MTKPQLSKWMRNNRHALRRAFRHSLPIILFAFFIGCDEVPTENDSGAIAPMAAKGGKKPKPPGGDPPAAWTTAQDIVYARSVTKKGQIERQIVVAGSGATDEAILFGSEVEVMYPVWSALGDAIFFEVTHGLQGGGIYAVWRDPATNSASAPQLQFPVSGGLPTMSPDGSKIAYADVEAELGDIWVRERAPDGSWGTPVNIDGNGPSLGLFKSWASDSRRLVATKEQDLVVYDIDPDGNGVIDSISETSITAGGPLEGQLFGGDLSWARTSDRVVVGRMPGWWMIDFNDLGNITTCMLSADGGGVSSWSPDDSKIVHGEIIGDIKVMTLGPVRADGCPAVLADEVLFAESSRCSGRSCERVRQPNWRRF